MTSTDAPDPFQLPGRWERLKARLVGPWERLKARLVGLNQRVDDWAEDHPFLSRVLGWSPPWW